MNAGGDEAGREPGVDQPAGVPPAAIDEAGRRARRGDPERVVGFTDGVFAIIITILVLEIGVPSNLDEQSLREALEEVGPTLIAWVISFFLVGMFWVAHRDIFTRVRSVNRDLVWLNLVFLLPVSLVPFASAVLGEYHDEPIALRLYGVTMILSSLGRMLLYGYVSRRPALLWEPISARERRFGRALSAVPIALYIVAMVLAEFSHQASLIIFFAVPGCYFLLITILRDRPATSADAREFS